MNEIVKKLETRAAIRRQIPTRKSVAEGKPDRIADLLDEAAQEIRRLEGIAVQVHDEILKGENDGVLLKLLSTAWSGKAAAENENP